MMPPGGQANSTGMLPNQKVKKAEETVSCVLGLSEKNNSVISVYIDFYSCATIKLVIDIFMVKPV
jgi:hypothetical protein